LWARTQEIPGGVVSRSGMPLTPFPGGHVCPDPHQVAGHRRPARGAAHERRRGADRRPARRSGADGHSGARWPRVPRPVAREVLPRGETLEVGAGFSSACWIGPPGSRAPDLGRLTYRSRTGVDRRGRVMLDYRARTWLAVDDANRFEVVAFPAEAGGILVMPVEDFARRWEVISR